MTVLTFFKPSALEHYTAAVAREVVAAVTPVQVTQADGVTSWLWVAPSHQAAAEHATRPPGRTGPIPIAVRGYRLAADTYLVFHCFRVRGPDRRDWTKGGR